MESFLRYLIFFFKHNFDHLGNSCDIHLPSVRVLLEQIYAFTRVGLTISNCLRCPTNFRHYLKMLACLSLPQNFNTTKYPLTLFLWKDALWQFYFIHIFIKLIMLVKVKYRVGYLQEHVADCLEQSLSVKIRVLSKNKDYMG